ncbi:MAG: zinc ribbon domain-containing protein [Acidobacteriia bacterium]|nr:zinc ribbon domain-containing protein [Terriglobia bacterium]
MNEQKPKINEQVDAIRWRMRHEKLPWRDEIRIIPRWIWGTVIALLGISQIGAQIVHRYTPPRDEPLLAIMAVAAGLALGVDFFLLLFGYVNRDAHRRGMNSTLWTLLAIFVPYLIGLIIYFLMREPLPYGCPQCGATVSARFNFCPHCKYNLRPTCPKCAHVIQPGDAYCPYCAYELKEVAAT